MGQTINSVSPSPENDVLVLPQASWWNSARQTFDPPAPARPPAPKGALHWVFPSFRAAWCYQTNRLPQAGRVAPQAIRIAREERALRPAPSLAPPPPQAQRTNFVDLFAAIARGPSGIPSSRYKR